MLTIVLNFNIYEDICHATLFIITRACAGPFLVFKMSALIQVCVIEFTKRVDKKRTL